MRWAFKMHTAGGSQLPLSDRTSMNERRRRDPFFAIRAFPPYPRDIENIVHNAKEVRSRAMMSAV